MRVLAALTYYDPHWTGLTRHAQLVAEGLVARGHSVSVLAVRHSQDLALRQTIHGVEVYRAPAMGAFSRGWIAPSFLSLLHRLVPLHDAVQIHTPLPEAAAVAALCRFHRRPLLMTHHGDLVMPAGFGNRILEGAGFALTFAAGRWASRVTSYSQDYALHSPLLRRFRDKVIAIPPPVEIPEPDPIDVEEMRGRFGVAGKRIVGLAGRWVEEKGFDILLDALPALRRSCPDVHVLFAGQSPAYEHLLERCRPAIEGSGCVTLIGLLRDRRKMAGFYRLCDVVALPSRSDMYALVQAEAMLCGTPVVAANIPGARVVVAETGMGLLVTPRDPLALADGLRTVLDAPERFRRHPAEIRACFDRERSIRMYEELLQEMIRQ